ncbi:prolyl oligopeptidase family serine peptidase [Microbacterium sp. LWH12-1.2]|uniref:prolyl oligopeptidase family serine peptidase n=1 Tax=Microbacterium sp. LWH12-1.2 TaxID=3135259 RepID=UPI00342D8E57
MSALTDSLSAALSQGEEYGRPGLPNAGFSLGRKAGRVRRGVYRSDGRCVAEPEGHLHRIAPSPDGRLIAAEWAADADENAVLAIIDAHTGEMRVHPHIRIRYDTVLWKADSRRLEVVASRDDQIVSLDVESGEWEATATAQGTRVRFFRGGRGGLLARRATDGGTVLIDRASDTCLGTFAALFRAMPLADGILVWRDAGLDAVDIDGGIRWRWDSTEQIVDVAVQGEQVVVLVVRGGRSVIVTLRDGQIVRTQEVTAGHDAVSATGISVDAGVLHVAVEGPLTPPQIVECDRIATLDRRAAPAPSGATTVRHEIRTDDGADLVVHVTSDPDPSIPRPLILTCYGGFGVAYLPAFEPTIPAWLAHGGAYATAQLRGGGEHGVQWRDAGSGSNKHRTIADLAAVARALVDRGITRPELLVLVGASLGGVIVASCALEHPGLCAGVVTTGAPLDLLGLDGHPLGRLWKSEFGDDGTPEGRERVRRISPLSQAEALPRGSATPEFLGIVLEKDTRVIARDTVRTVEALLRAGGSARMWTAPAAGHGSNDLTSLHELGLTALDFAARLTMEHSE